MVVVDWKSIAVNNGWVHVKTCSSCSGTKHTYKNNAKPGWHLYIWPGMNVFRVTDNFGVKKEESTLDKMQEKLSTI